MARRRRGNRDETEMSPLLNETDETLTDETVNEPLRYMVLGGDDVLVDKACGTILGERDAFKFGIFKTAQVRGQQVSVLKAPSHWLEHLKSYYILSNGVKSLKNELKYFELLLFPGPHAFLLVHRDVKNSGREYYLLKALSGVFGEEVLDYCMVIFIDEARNNDPKKNTCLKMCGGRHHILQNTDESVNEFLKKTMRQNKHRAAENYFEAEYKENYFRRLKKQLISYKDREKQLNNKMKALESSNKQMSEKLSSKEEDLKNCQNREKQLNNDLKALESSNKQMSEELSRKEDLKNCQDREKQLNNKMKALESSNKQMSEKLKRKQEDLKNCQDREKQLNNDLKALECSNKQMSEELKKKQEDLIIWQDRVRQKEKDNKELQEKVDQLKDNEKQLQSNLTAAKVTEGFLNSRLQSECDRIQRKEEIQVKEKELHDEERELDRRVVELDKREKNLDEREKQIEIRERELRQADRGSSEHHQTTAVTPSDDCEGELKSREHSQASESHGIHKPVRRSSKELEPPNMSESGPLHSL